MAGIKVVLDIYSGQPNPQWELSDEQVEELSRRLEESRQEPRGERRKPPYLGYRGFIIRNPKLQAGLPYEIEAHGGSLAVTETEEGARGDDRRLEFYEDVGGIHDWLLEEARRRDFSEEIAAMGGPRER